jgi:hypothetical protein
MPLARDQTAFLQQHKHGAHGISVGRGPANKPLLRDPVLLAEQDQQNELVGGHAALGTPHISLTVQRPVGRP